MATAQLSRLRPQITALSSLFENPQDYLDALIQLLVTYRSEVDFTASGITPHSLIKKLNIPEIVITQLSISYNHLVKVYPHQAIMIAEKLWDREYFEYKQLSLLLLSGLPSEQLGVFFDHLSRSITSETEVPILSVILELARRIPEIRLDDRWLSIITIWVSADNTHLKKFGLKAMTNFINGNKQPLLPDIFKIIKPVFSNPNIAIHSELLILTKELTSHSMNETAAFLISIGIQYPNPEVRKFIRKCTPLFPGPLALNIRESTEI